MAADHKKELIGSFTGYAATVGILLAASYPLGLVDQDVFAALLLGFFVGLGLTRWFWKKAETAWEEEREGLHAYLARVESRPGGGEAGQAKGSERLLN